MAKDNHEILSKSVEAMSHAFGGNLDQIDSEIAKLTAEIKTTRAAVSSPQKRVPIARQLVADYLQLLDESAVPKQAYLQKKQERLDQERELELQLGRLNR